MADEKKIIEPEQKQQAAATPVEASKPAEQTSAPAPNNSFMEKYWQPFLKPVVALVVICLITSLLLGVTNAVTKPIIEQNTQIAADNTRKELLPEADGFEEVVFSTLPANISSMYKATNNTGYVIEAYSNGYGGKVPAMVAFSMDGTIVGVKFLQNNETPGLGQKLGTEEGFRDIFIGSKNERITLTPADRIANATISSNAAAAAVNAAVELFSEKVLGKPVGVVEMTPEEVRQMLLPDAKEFTKLTVTAQNVAEVYLADDGNFIIYGQDSGFHSKPITAIVAVTPEGNVLAVWGDTENESKGYGYEIGSNQEYLDQFAGKTSGEVSGEASAVEVVAGATVSSRAFARAVQNALDALEIVKGAV